MFERDTTRTRARLLTWLHVRRGSNKTPLAGAADSHDTSGQNVKKGGKCNIFWWNRGTTACWHGRARMRAHPLRTKSQNRRRYQKPRGSPLLFLLTRMMPHECIIHTRPALIRMHATVPRRAHARSAPTRANARLREVSAARGALSITSQHNAAPHCRRSAQQKKKER